MSLLRNSTSDLYCLANLVGLVIVLGIYLSLSPRWTFPSLESLEAHDKDVVSYVNSQTWVCVLIQYAFPWKFLLLVTLQVWILHSCWSCFLWHWCKFGVLLYAFGCSYCCASSWDDKCSYNCWLINASVIAVIDNYSHYLTCYWKAGVWIWTQHIDSQFWFTWWYLLFDCIARILDSCKQTNVYVCCVLWIHALLIVAVFFHSMLRMFTK
jgi:hypothetical protein